VRGEASRDVRWGEGEDGGRDERKIVSATEPHPRPTHI